MTVNLHPKIIKNVISTGTLTSVGVTRLSEVPRRWAFLAAHPSPASDKRYVSPGSSPVSSMGTEMPSLFALMQEVSISIISFEVKKQTKSWERRNLVFLSQSQTETQTQGMRYTSFKMPIICHQNWSEVVTFNIFLMPLLNTPVWKGKSSLLELETIENTLY